ncbi:metallophosphoesterase [Tuwongella immobilis]|uniref:Calcineurin-like phosphoesterase domain-containing protein n=1 Tax=Tuwongella immobilis TaxID=692036 RepID=A0A6C2YVL3_9BACT|nr:metallophosphoesterase [Tuwongella immobilis]VIP05546.1 serine threonine protein phosphatase : Metallophosphoesterase OS=Magnetococcus sp. (strain MC-1) GN=Mmc1_2000 PE=4 SV=1: Metallophos [Tuwongella immobilis]VTS08448.1 serine threonine protein phosphatase : Metallophosphoesterase OS=Magnetococcus sp. (strain MC-1) GN=Mmc1_2000 PE=4 SV=1: Metallophos [Tuwongella immobilis]
MTIFGFLGDLHGHLQLGLCMMARWQQQTGKDFEAIFLAGDVGTFTRDAELDSTTRRHARTNPCELEFLTQWAISPPAPWLARLFEPTRQGGLGLTAPVVMVHGNHEGFFRLQECLAGERPKMPVRIEQLPTVDSGGWIRYLPSGWVLQTPKSGKLVGGIGGIEPGQRTADYPDLAYIDEGAILQLLDGPKLDVLLTHQGPSAYQGPDAGSESLQILADEAVARWWVHGHSLHNREIGPMGPEHETMVLPLGGVGFGGKGPHEGEPGALGFSRMMWDDSGTVAVERELPPFWREYRRKRWLEHPDGRLICPDLLHSS